MFLNSASLLLKQEQTRKAQITRQCYYFILKLVYPYEISLKLKKKPFTTISTVSPVANISGVVIRTS